MTIEKFLSFWSQNNTGIIEGLIALIILLALFLAYRSFLGKKSEEAGSGVSLREGVDAAQLERTLQKILENQGVSASANKNHDEASISHPDIENVQASEEGGEVSEAAAAEVAQLRSHLTESSKKIETLQAQLAQAQQQVAAASSSTAAESGAGGGEAPSALAAEGVSSEERDQLNAKVRDLEARLAEYEIISEDIADLSRYRDENDNLKKQLEALKGAAPAAAPAPPAAATPEPEAPAAPTQEPQPVAAESAAVESEPAAAPVVEAASAPAPAPAAAEEPGSDIIDDELMKEFAAAVEGQKSLDKAAEKAGDGSKAAAKTSDDTDKLMNEFENFVTKKS